MIDTKILEAASNRDEFLAVTNWDKYLHVKYAKNNKDRPIVSLLSKLNLTDRYLVISKIETIFDPHKIGLPNALYNLWCAIDDKK